jgi:hypothetical protein
MLDALCPLAVSVTWAPRPLPTKPGSQKDPFAPLDDLAATFDAFRTAHVRFLGAARKLAMGDAPYASKLPPPNVLAALQNSAISPSETGEVVAPEYVRGLSFAYALVHSVDPGVSLLSQTDVVRCMESFVERAAQSIRQDPGAVADRFKEAFRRKESRRSVVESLADPRGALRDSSMNDAVVLHLATVLSTVIVVAVGQKATQFPPSAEGDAQALLVRWILNEEGGSFVTDGPKAPLRAVRRRLWVLRGSPAYGPGCSAAALSDVADAIGLPKDAGRKKAELAALLAQSL